MSHFVFPTFELAPINPGGAGVLIAAGLRSLAEAGFDATALCAFPEAEVAKANRLLVRWALPGRARALHLDSLAAGAPAGSSPYETNALKVAAALGELSKTERFEVVEFIDYTGLGCATLQARREGRFPTDATLVVRVHGTLGAIDAAEGVPLDDERRLMHRQEAEALREADRVLVPTRAVGEEYAVRYGIDPTRMVLSPPPMEVILRGLSPSTRLPDPEHFLFYGKLQEVKGVDIFARAAVSLVQQEPGRRWRFTLVGRDTPCTAHGRMVSSCLAELIPSEVVDRFEFIPQIDRSLLREIVRSVGTAVTPSRSESFCLAAHELRALGVPLLVPERPPFAEYFGAATGALLFDGSPESLARQMRRLADERELRQGLARAPRPSYPEFAAVYRELLARSRTEIASESSP